MSTPNDGKTPPPDELPVACAATPREELRRQIMDSRVPKNEREWWAAREIERLETARESDAYLGDDDEKRSLRASIETLRQQVVTLESVATDYREAVAQAQDALGEYWVTTPTLPEACRAMYAECVRLRQIITVANDDDANFSRINETLERCEMVVSDDPVEAVMQIVDALNADKARLDWLETGIGRSWQASHPDATIMRSTIDAARK